MLVQPIAVTILQKLQSSIYRIYIVFFEEKKEICQTTCREKWRKSRGKKSVGLPVVKNDVFRVLWKKCRTTCREK